MLHAWYCMWQFDTVQSQASTAFCPRPKILLEPELSVRLMAQEAKADRDRSSLENSRSIKKIKNWGRSRLLREPAPVLIEHRVNLTSLAREPRIARTERIWDCSRTSVRTWNEIVQEPGIGLEPAPMTYRSRTGLEDEKTDLIEIYRDHSSHENHWARSLENQEFGIAQEQKELFYESTRLKSCDQFEGNYCDEIISNYYVLMV